MIRWFCNILHQKLSFKYALINGLLYYWNDKPKPYFKEIHKKKEIHRLNQYMTYMRHNIRWTNFANRLVTLLSDKTKKAVEENALLLRNQKFTSGCGATVCSLSRGAESKCGNSKPSKRKAVYPLSNWHDFIYKKSYLDILSHRNTLMSP